MSAHGRRAVLHVDMDCFYAAVERLRHPETQGKPLVVVMYGEWRGGAIIAVSYEARAFGIKRNMRGDDARRLCPECHVVTVETANGKADLENYRDASAAVMALLQSVAGPEATLERASVDECYIDVSAAAVARMSQAAPPPNPHPATTTATTAAATTSTTTTTTATTTTAAAAAAAVGLASGQEQEAQQQERCQVRTAGDTVSLSDWSHSNPLLCDCPLADEPGGSTRPACHTVNGTRDCGASNKPDWLLWHASLIAQEMRVAVQQTLGFTCSAGVAHNKVLAKLATGMHKPNGQTTLLQSCVPRLMETMPISEIRGLGGKLGDVLTKKGFAFVGDLLVLDEAALQAQHGPRLGTWVWNVARGVNFDAVTTRALAKSVGCSKTFIGPAALTTFDEVEKWFSALGNEIQERLEKDGAANSRRATLLTVSYSFGPGTAAQSNSQQHLAGGEKEKQQQQQQQQTEQSKMTATGGGEGGAAQTAPGVGGAFKDEVGEGGAGAGAGKDSSKEIIARWNGMLHANAGSKQVVLRERFIAADAFAVFKKYVSASCKQGSFSVICLMLSASGFVSHAGTKSLSSHGFFSAGSSKQPVVGGAAVVDDAIDEDVLDRTVTVGPEFEPVRSDGVQPVGLGESEPAIGSCLQLGLVQGIGLPIGSCNNSVEDQVDQHVGCFKCVECRQWIPESDRQCHSDFHFAQSIGARVEAKQPVSGRHAGPSKKRGGSGGASHSGKQPKLFFPKST